MRRTAIALVLISWPLPPQQAEWDELHRRWNAMATTGNHMRDRIQAGVFDVGVAKKFSKQVRELERCGMWPRPEEK